MCKLDVVVNAIQEKLTTQQLLPRARDAHAASELRASLRALGAASWCDRNPVAPRGSELGAASWCLSHQETARCLVLPFFVFLFIIY